MQILTRRRVLESLAGVAASSLLGCGSATPSGSTAAATPAINPQPVPAGAITNATLAVTATTKGSIIPGFASLSYAKTELCHPFFSASNTNLIALFRLLGPGILRIGGSPVDEFTWTPNGKGQTYAQVAPSDVASFAAFVKATGWQCLYGVNLGGASLPAGTAGYTTAALAAAEVAYATTQLGSSLYGIEIGNEPDSYGNSDSYYPGNWSLGQYETLWNQFRTTILATTPNAFITGPAGGHLSTWTVPFSEDQTKSKLSLLTDHYYKIAGTTNLNPTIAQLLANPDTTLISNLQLMQAGQAITGIPYRIAECNSISAGGGPGVSNAYASALWMLDFLFTCAQGGAVGVNVEGGQGAVYAPIDDDETNVLAIMPEFYGMLFFTLAGNGGLYTTQLSTGSLNISAYAVKTTAGLNIVVVNKEAQSLDLTLQLPVTPNYANVLVLSQSTSGSTTPDLTALAGVTIQGASIGINGSFTPAAAYRAPSSGTQVTCYAPAASATMIQIM